MSADMKNSRLMEYLSQHPNTGDQYLSDAEEEKIYSWNEESMSQSLRCMQYAVRGEVVMKADQLASQGREILYTNIGNPHQVGQQPITYFRQVLALCNLPASCGVDHPQLYDMFPKDVVQRACKYCEIIGPSGTGAYTTHSQGILGFRKHVANYNQRRDCYKCYPGNVCIPTCSRPLIYLPNTTKSS
jgi:aspartate/methionine/tyrosine aminotransferase